MGRVTARADHWPLGDNRSVVLHERTPGGLHDYLAGRLARLFPGADVLDVGSGTGAWASRLNSLGVHSLTLLDREEPGWKGGSFVPADLDEDWPSALKGRSFNLITAIEVIEHLEAPSRFIRQCADLLKPEGRLIITTPNVDGIVSRLRFLLKGTVRQFDTGDPTHLSPIFTHILRDRWLPKAHLGLDHHLTHPEKGVGASRPAIRQTSKLIARGKPGTRLSAGDSNIYILKPE